MADFKIDNGKLFKTADEVPVPEIAKIEGTIPSWLNGSFIRVGPGKFDFENTSFTVNHWLDGYALLSKFEINSQNQTVEFQSKYLQSDAYKKAVRAGKPLITEFGTKAYSDPTKNMFSRFFSSLMPEMSDNDSVSLFKLGSSSSPSPKNDQIFVTSNTQYFHEINPCTLETGKKFDYHKCFGLNGVSVHPIFDYETGITYNVGFSISSGLKYNIIKLQSPVASPDNILHSNSNSNEVHHCNNKINSSQDLIDQYETVCSIPSRWNSSIGYFHSFGSTKNYLIFIEQPYTISLTKAAKSLIRGDSFKDWLDWRPKEKCRFYIIDKATGEVNKREYYSNEPFFFLHIINCFEESEYQIVVDIITYSSPEVLESMYMNKLRNNLFEQQDPPKCQRFVIPYEYDIISYHSGGENLIKGDHHNAKAHKSDSSLHSEIILTPELLSDYQIELPTINPNYYGAEAKYFYGVCDGKSNTNNNEKEESKRMLIKTEYTKNSLCKVNTETKKTLLWFKNDFNIPGEPIFIPRPKSEATIKYIIDDDDEDNEDEDDGILISSVTDLRENYDDFLIFLEGKNLEEIGRVKFKNHLPQAMHGIFLQDTNK